MIKLPLTIDGLWLDYETPWLQDLIKNPPQFGPLAYMYDNVALGRITSFEHKPATRELYAIIDEPYIDSMLLELQPLTRCELKSTSIAKLETGVTLRIYAIHFVRSGYYTFLGTKDFDYTDAYSISSCALDLKDMVRLSVLAGKRTISLMEYSSGAAANI